MFGTLFVVATPIGNLEDITLRALRILREVSLVAAEDTRRTANLLLHHAIPTRTISFHEHNARGRVPQLLERLRGGESVALVTDAGTPGVSDPGVELVRACILEGISVDPIPGASAPLAAALGSGFPLVPFTVFGFVPVKAKDRTSWFEEAAGVRHTFTFFEAPHRIASTLAEAVRYFGERQIVVGRELTKLHQEFLRGKSAELLQTLGQPRGEYTLVVGPAPDVDDEPAATDGEVLSEFWRTTELGLPSRRAVVAEVAKKCGRSVKDVYRLVEQNRKSVE